MQPARIQIHLKRLEYAVHNLRFFVQCCSAPKFRHITQRIDGGLNVNALGLCVTCKACHITL